MAKKQVHHKKPGMTVSLAMVAGLAPTLAFAYEGYKIPGDQGGIVEAAHRMTMRMTGYEWKGNTWAMGEAIRGLGPLLIGGGVHKLANRMGINRMISNAGIPILRV
jgi:hypothetical protein